MERPKNILLIWTDQQRPDTIGAYGNPRIQTPHLDRLAAEGVLFEQAYCAQPVCSPSRATVMTGLYPHTHGVLSNGTLLAATTPTLAEMLRPAGYACGYIGKWHLGHELRPQRGFEECWGSTEDGYAADHGTEGYSAYHDFLLARGYTPTDPHRDGTIFSRVTAAGLPEEAGKPAFLAGEAIRFLEGYREQPFLLSINFLEPHPPRVEPRERPYPPEEMTLPASWYRELEETVPWRYRYRRAQYTDNDHPDVKVKVPTNDEWGWKEQKSRYWGLCTLVDRHVGRILQRLEELGLADDTVVVYTSDHGDMMGEHRLLNKGLPYDGAARVPWIIKVPGLRPRRIATPVGHVDLIPTMLDLLGLPAPEHLPGTSLSPFLANGDRNPEAGAVFIEWNGRSGSPPEFADPTVLGRLDETERRLRVTEVRTIRRGRWKLNVHLSGEHELYDLQDDPGEMHNALRDPGSEPVVRALYEQLREWQRQTNDPLALPDPTAD